MKILILNWRDTKHPLAGGAEQSLFEHAKYWQKQHNEIIWFSSAFVNAPKQEVLEGITILRKGSHYTVHLWAFWYYITRKFPQADIVIDSFHFVPFFSVLYMRKKERIIGLLNEVAGRLWFFNISAPLARTGYFIEPFIIRFYKRNVFITGSDSAKKDLVTIGLSPNNIYVVNHGFHLHAVDASIKKESRPTVLFLGRIAKDKGIVDALEAFTEVRKEIPNVVLWVVGQEEREGIFTELLQTLDKETQEHIRYWGFVNQKQKFKLLRKAWLLVHPSYREGWGLTVIEAASQSTPTVGYNVAGLQDSVQNGKTGFLVEPQNIAMLQDAIRDILNDKEYYKRVSTNALKWSKNFTWERSVKKSWKVIKEDYEKNK